MGNFWSIFGFSNFFDKDVRVLMVGLDAAGKTTILYKLKLGEVVSSCPTIGFNVEELKYKKLNLTVWDIGGQDKIRGLWKHYYKNCQAVVYVVDSQDDERVEEADAELEKILAAEELKDAAVLIYANKQDLPRALSPSEITRRLKLYEANNHKWFVQGTSATNGSGLYEGLEWLNGAIKA